MILDIVQLGHPVLRERCRPIETVDDEVRRLAEDMTETMYAANGIGLAAPQVAVPLRMAVIDVSHDPDCISFLKVDGEEADLAEWMPLVFINPELELIEPKESEPEGCLSIRDVRAEVKRPTVVKAKLELLDGRTIELECDGLLARALQHEIDHLNGVLFIDRISPAAKVRLKRKLKRLAAEA
jgi:peptide deformylase